MEHVLLRVSDVMQESFPIADHREPLRLVGRTMAAGDLDSSRSSAPRAS